MPHNGPYGAQPKQVLVHPAILPEFERWLSVLGLGLRCIGTFGEDDLPTWVIELAPPEDERTSR